MCPPQAKGHGFFKKLHPYTDKLEVLLVIPTHCYKERSSVECRHTPQQHFSHSAHIFLWRTTLSQRSPGKGVTLRKSTIINSASAPFSFSSIQPRLPHLVPLTFKLGRVQFYGVAYLAEHCFGKDSGRVPCSCVCVQRSARTVPAQCPHGARTVPARCPL